MVGLVAVRSVAAGDTPVWNPSRPLSYGTTDPVLPGAPQDVTASSEGTSATVRWSPPQDQGSYAVTHYGVTSEPASAGCIAELTECVIAGMSPGTYTFRVQALSGAGWGPWSEWSEAVTVVQPVPASLAVTGSRQGPRLTVRITSTGLAEGTLVTLHVRPATSAAFAAQAKPIALTAAGGASWSRVWRDRRPVQVYASAGEIRSAVIRIR